MSVSPRETKATCPYCGVGCGVIIQSQGDDITGVRGDPDHPANFGRLCTKGSTLHLSAQRTIQWQTRALYPELRNSKDAPRQRVAWDAALDHVAQKFADCIRTHGPDSVAFYISGQLLTEDYYVFNKLAKGLIGTNNLDTNSRLCMSSAVAGYKQTLGADAPPAAYEDFDHCETLFIAGSNTAFAHPIVFRRIEDAKKKNPGMRIVVVDPRRTDTALQADLHLAIQPGTDIALFNGMLHILLWEDLVDLDYIGTHTEGFAELKRTVRDYTPAFVADTCGIKAEDLQTAALWFAQSKATLSLYCQGLNQSSSGTAKNAALINLHLATGQIGKPGAGPFSLTGQGNAMGGREVGGMSNLLPAHRDLANPEHRAEVAALWGVESVPEKPGKTAVEMFEAVRNGEIKMIWIACTNPAQSLPDQKVVHEALRKAELVVVQEAYKTTATVPYADVLLPAATWGEKEGTVTNSERRITRVNVAVPAMGQARADWDIAVDFARRLEHTLRPGQATLFPYQTAEQVWNEHRESTRGRDLDITGLSYRILETAGPQQWPMPEGATHGKVRLYEDGIFPTANGKAKFVNTMYTQVAEPVDARYPFRLNTGRLRDQWHSMSRTGTVPQLFAHAPEPSVQMNPNDMERRQIGEGSLVYVTTRRGSQVLLAQASEEIAPGQAFIGMHWGPEFVSGTAGHGHAALGVNALTIPALDPSSKQPELKHAAAKIVKADLAWSYVVFGWLPQERALEVQQALREYMPRFVYASCVLFGREKIGVLFRAAAHEPAPEEVRREIEAHFGLDRAEVLAYADARKGNMRRLLVQQDSLQAVALAGDLAAEGWLKEYLQNGQSVASLRLLLLMPTTKPPAGFHARGKVICSCLNVAESEIAETLEELSGPPEALLSALQGTLKCGTNCGSCVPEIKRILLQKASATTQ
ncbi:MAG: nitrate reductase [Burkholderiaceae bacterium]|nr:MAG: nitrate reductase [Burkholderiaceae bacterium]